MVSSEAMDSEDTLKAIKKLYDGFDAPIAALDCGSKCAPYNERGVPFCCDTHHIVPAAYLSEWSYYQGNTDLWHLWESDDEITFAQMQAETPDGMFLIECLGHQFCQRDYRSVTCRSFPFFPYFNSQKEFIGLSYYWVYEDRCWVISNLDVVTVKYRNQFMQSYFEIFQLESKELENFAHYSQKMREVFNAKQRMVPLLDRDGLFYLINPKDETLNLCNSADYGKHGPYEIAARLRFPDEE